MRRQTTRRRTRGLGFTLLELLVVMVIIGIIISFILMAALDGIRRAEERATQALIAKLDQGVTDRLNALTTLRADFNAAHSYIAAIWPGAGFIPNQQSTLSIPAGGPRAAVIAQYDRIKAEMPDVFTLQGDTNYPFNFAAMPYTAGPSGTAVGYVPAAYAPYLLPIGVGMVNDPTIPSYGGNPSPLPQSNVNSVIFPNSTGIFGASYPVIGGLTRQLAQQLGGSPNWFDGTDNNQNGLIDEVGESGLTYSGSPATPLYNLLANHTHKTARAETLYALLVYSTSPLGSVFNPDDFSDTEVKDTDQDGLMEFVDAWGEPLQFYRWPIFYYGQDKINPDVQRGYLAYTNALVPRDQDPLDSNQQLVAPAWWSNGFNTGGPVAGSAPLSGGAILFQQFFHNLTDPYTNISQTGLSVPNAGFWDRGTKYCQRRAYYSRPLILSAGPNKVPGVARVDPAYFQQLGDYASQKTLSGYAVGGAGPLSSFPSGTAASDTPWLIIENQAGSVTPNRTADAYQTPYSFTTGGSAAINQAIDAAIQELGSDDITNQNLSSPGGGIR